MNNSALREGEQDHGPVSTDTEKFARMLELSSLGSEDSRRERLAGARVLAEQSIGGSPWINHAPPWPNIATLHRSVAGLFEAENQPEPSELWLRAALNRAIDGPAATRLATLLEQRRATQEAVFWYQRAAETADPAGAARLAVLCELKGDQELATLLLCLGRSQIAEGRLVQVDELTSALAMADQHHRTKLISDCDDEDLLFWAGCALLVSDRRDAAGECYSAAAMTRNGHPGATLSLYDLQMSSAPEERKNAAGTDLDDLDILAKAAVGGDRNAVDAVLSRIRPLVVRYCRARVGEKTFASTDDVAQEVCLAVLTALPSYRDQGRPFLAFVYGIASHKVADAHRAASRNRVDPVPEIPDCPEPADGPEQQAMQTELAGRMNKLLGMLPDKQREILILRVVMGLSAEETAEAVQSTPGAVRVAQHRALGRLRRILASERKL